MAPANLRIIFTARLPNKKYQAKTVPYSERSHVWRRKTNKRVSGIDCIIQAGPLARVSCLTGLPHQPQGDDTHWLKHKRESKNAELVVMIADKFWMLQASCQQRCGTTRASASQDLPHRGQCRRWRGLQCRFQNEACNATNATKLNTLSMQGPEAVQDFACGGKGTEAKSKAANGAAMR